jgi:hypothetical protein
MGTTTEGREPQETCPACSMEFPSAEGLAEHETTHREGVTQS